MSIESVYRNNSKRVYAFFYVKTFDQMLAEDLTSQTFMIMLNKLHDSDVAIDDENKYLSGIMRNVWLRFLQEKYATAVQSVEEIDDFSRYVEEEVQTAKDEGLEKFAKPYIDKLPEKQRIILHMRLIDKRTLKEICAATGKDMNYVRTTQKRGIAKLKELLQADNVTLGSTLV